MVIVQRASSFWNFFLFKYLNNLLADGKSDTVFWHSGKFFWRIILVKA